ncbi:MAG: hypothetical protein ACP5N2_02370 [Candidatus Nanoarchaeia archaeon]
MDAKSKLSANARWKFYILASVLIISLSILVSSLSFTSNPQINNGVTPIYTTEDLICTWEVSGDTVETNVSWYKDGVLYLNQTVIGSSSMISYVNTTKHETWICQVILSNSSDVITENVSITIVNSAQSKPYLYNSSIQVPNNYELYEDTTYNFIMTSLDPDDDDLTYRFTPNDICSVTNIYTGQVQCIPTHAAITGSSSPGAENNVSELLTLWSDDNSELVSIGNNHTFALIPVNDQADFTNSINNRSLNSGISLNIEVSAEDEEENYPLDFALWSDLNADDCPSELIITPSGDTTSVISFDVPTNNVCVGNWTVIVNVTDSSGYNTSRDAIQMIFGVQINITNSIPNFTSVISQNKTQGESFLVWFYANDSDVGDNLTFNVTRDSSVANCSVSMFNWSAITVNNGYLNASGYINVSNLTNNHVACRQVNLVVRDQKGDSRSRNIVFNITNANDAPTVHNVGRDGNMSNQSSRLYQTFIYRINATDPDQLTYDYANTGVLTYTSDDSRFTPNLLTGTINVTPTNASYVGYWIINLTASDGILNSTGTLYLNITANNVPVLNLVPNNRNLSQNDAVILNFTVSELDNENLTMIFASLTSFSDSLYGDYFNITSQVHNGTANIETWRLNLTKNSARERNNLVGNHRINITFKDSPILSFGSESMGVLNFTIQNENDAPFFDMNQNNESDNVTLGIVVKDRAYSMLLKATDFDIYLDEMINESLDFTFYLDATNFTDYSISRFDNSLNMFSLEFTPIVDGAQYLIINVTDQIGALDSQTIFFNVSENSSSPLFQSIKPYYNSSSNQTVQAFISASLYPTNITSLIIDENTTLTFDALIINDSGIEERNSLNLEWYIDGELIKTIINATPSVNSNSSVVYFDYFSAGLHNVTIVAEDIVEYASTWTWLVNVTNVNRLPVYCEGNLEDLVPPDWVIDRTRDMTDYYLSYMSGTQRFYDPDDDATNTGNVSKNCSIYNAPNLNSLTFSLSDPDSCSEAEFTFTNTSSFVVVPNLDGDCMLQFIATDEYNESVNATDLVWIKFTGVEPSEGDTQDNRRSGGSTTKTQIVTVPVDLEVDKPVPIKIIAPGVVSIYANKTIYIPLKIKNTWTAEVRGVELSGVSINATMSGENAVKIHFDQSYFSVIPLGGESNILLEVSNYRKEGPFEIVIYAKVADPEFTDSTSIYISSLEQTSKGDEVKSKVTFAKDMLSENPLCRELNELLDRADAEAESENYAEAIKLVDGVINGCKYLMKEEEVRRETPSIVKQGINISREYALEIIGGAVVLLLVTLTFYAMAALKRKITEK